MDDWFGNVVYYLYMELAIILMRLVSIGFFLTALVLIWRYMVKNEVSFSDDEEGNKTRSCAMLVTHTFALLAFVGAQLYTLLQMDLSFKSESDNIMLTVGLILWTFIDTVNSIVMLIAYNQLNIYFISAIN